MVLKSEGREFSSMDDRISVVKVARGRWSRLAMTTFVVLFAMNMLDYLDRNMLMSMQPQIKGELRHHRIPSGAC